MLLFELDYSTSTARHYPEGRSVMEGGSANEAVRNGNRLQKAIPHYECTKADILWAFKTSIWPFRCLDICHRTPSRMMQQELYPTRSMTIRSYKNQPDSKAAGIEVLNPWPIYGDPRGLNPMR